MNTLCLILLQGIIYKNIWAQESQPAQSINEYEFNNENIAKGDYNFRFVTADNEIMRQESGYFQDIDDEGYIVTGFYSYIDPNGKKHLITYYADKTGYHPTIVEDSDVVQLEADKNTQSISEISFGVPPAIVGSLLG